MRCDRCDNYVELATPGHGWLCKTCKLEHAAAILLLGCEKAMKHAKSQSFRDLIQNHIDEAQEFGVS